MRGGDNWCTKLHRYMRKDKYNKFTEEFIKDASEGACFWRVSGDKYREIDAGPYRETDKYIKEY